MHETRPIGSLMSDISQVFEVDDIFIFLLAISEIIRVITPSDSIYLISSMHKEYDHYHAIEHRIRRMRI